MRVPPNVRARAFKKMAAALRKRADSMGAITKPTRVEVATVRRRIADDLRRRADELDAEATTAGEEAFEHVLELMTRVQAHAALATAFCDPQHPPPPRGEA
jgi:hypothetical protein